MSGSPPDSTSTCSHDTETFSSDRIRYLRDDGSDPEFSNVIRVVPNLMAVYHLAACGCDYFPAAKGCAAGRIAIENLAIPFLMERGFLKRDDVGDFTEGPNVPIFVCDAEAPKEGRVKRVNQNVSTLTTIAEQKEASIPLVAHFSKRGLSSSDVKAHREKMLRSIGMNASEASPFAEKSCSIQEENGARFDVLTFVFVTALPEMKG